MELNFQIKTNKNQILKLARDYGFESIKVQGLFSKWNMRKGIVRSGLLDLIWTDQIRSREKEIASRLGKMTSTAATMASGEWTSPTFVDSVK
jgi:hypothetical protein